jgi:hypothetical protein
MITSFAPHPCGATSVFKYPRVLTFGILLCAGVAIVAGAWKIFFSDDPHFVWIGPRTPEIDRLRERLEIPIDMRDFQQPRNLRDTLAALHEQLDATGNDFAIVTDQPGFFDQHDIKDIGLIEIRFSLDVQRMPLRQFLKAILEQIPTRDAVIILWQYGHLELTTAGQFQLAREQYHEDNPATALDYLRQAISSLAGRKNQTPIPALKPGGRVKRLDGAA